MQHLLIEGWTVEQVADTASRQAGKDIVARGSGDRRLWVSVKGWPEKSVNTKARHWFAGALFDVVLYRDEDATVELAIGLPAGFSTYDNLLGRVQWLRRNLPFSIFWVDQGGGVTVAG